MRISLQPTAPRKVAIGLGCGLILWAVCFVLRPTQSQGPPVIAIGPSRVKPQIFITLSRVFVLAADSSLWYWGRAESYVDCVPPQRIGHDSDWAAIAPDETGSHLAALKINGTLWEWARGHRFDTAAPRQLLRETNWQAVAAGVGHTVALRRDGTLWARGGTIEHGHDR